tara:strand:+ start:16134 stop:17021 length:888 start_codon:yes stop_codon:yes gene_type:complete
MKPEFFHGSVEKGSNKLYTESNRQIIAQHGAFIKIGSNDIFYRVESIEDLHIKRKFTTQGKHITIKGNYQYRLSPDDVIKIYFDEYEAVETGEIITPTDKQFGGYSIGQKIYAQGGIASTSSSNITGESVELEVTKVDENEKILNIEISRPGKYITPPKNPIKFMNEEGEEIEINIEFDLSSDSSVAERSLIKVNNDKEKTLIEMAYPLPQGIKEGEFFVSKQIIFLDKRYSHDSVTHQPCQIISDRSPIGGLPLIPQAISPTAAISTYNKSMEMLDARLQEIEVRLTRVENRNI